MDEQAAVAERYARFARDEAPGRSALYAEWASAVASDPALAAVLARIAAAHRQPPLVFAVTRLLGAPESGEWPSWLLAHADEVVAECGSRSLQTNEPLRCAVLLPALSLIDGPIALLEVGASAGLCLYPDRYAYRYASADGDTVLGDSPVVLHSRFRGPLRPPLRLPDVVWRAGIDLHPLDAGDAGDRRFLETLVWPGEEGRESRIRSALDVVAADPPLLIERDAVEAIPEVAALAPPGATLVITTPGVLAHVPYAGRVRIIDAARAAGRWITLDAPSLHDGWSAPIDQATWPSDAFALALDGDVLAAVDPLGGFVEWRAGLRASHD
ncbi:DUF2332 domain-containing protein [Microbacterium candidum]|uniref:DUF2332 domain-containing protein n=1 Tax=Microbacterium candidum TaxID=3041922 RepID=A0ABT7N308_9MICO|nr:DUF2332 domain-containing protein [Microbacterium sp. ASV49]MDL9981094.1 DUF2332 domain-containing protein [Microbacterium sp. ASV49]